MLLNGPRRLEYPSRRRDSPLQGHNVLRISGYPETCLKRPRRVALYLARGHKGPVQEVDGQRQNDDHRDDEGGPPDHVNSRRYLYHYLPPLLLSDGFDGPCQMTVYALQSFSRSTKALVEPGHLRTQVIRLPLYGPDAEGYL